MPNRTSQAGGLFLMLAIVLGSIWGVYVGQPMLGVLRGTGIGFVKSSGFTKACALTRIPGFRKSLGPSWRDRST